MINKIKIFLKDHYVAFLFSLLVGLIYVAPHLFFIASLGEKYQGLPMISTANEDAYLFRIQEIIDGHYLIGSPVYFEYKEEWPMAPPVGEMFYAIPVMLTGISLANVLIASKFLLPFILFLLIYFLINNLTVNNNLLSNKINAVSGALLVTLGYDLADYRSLWLLLTGKIEYGEKFLLWARPVNPILGAIFLFSFLLCLWFIIKNSRYKKSLIIIASIFLSLMIGSYFFSWGIALSILGILILLYLLKQEYKIIKNLFLVILFAIIITLPLWYMSFTASSHPWYKAAVLRNGLFYTHQPLFNKVILASLLFYLLLFIGPIIKRFLLIIKNKLSLLKYFDAAAVKDWHIFSLSFLLGSFWVFNQQIITGLTIWPYHFVQYTIPLAMVAVYILLYNVIKKWQQYLWLLIISVIACSSLIYGIYDHVEAYKSSCSYYANSQDNEPIFNWLNRQEKDCVVLVNERDYDWYSFNGLIPAFTHCNIYASEQTYSLMPYERSYFNYLVNLRLKGMVAEDINEYIKNNKGEVISYLFSNWKGLFDITDFSDFSDPLLEERIKKLPQDYREFIIKSFENELKKYRLDFILSVGPLPESIRNELPNIKLIEEFDAVFIYDFRN